MRKRQQKTTFKLVEEYLVKATDTHFTFSTGGEEEMHFTLKEVETQCDAVLSIDEGGRRIDKYGT